MHGIFMKIPYNLVLTISFGLLTLILLTWRIGWAPNYDSKWQMGFNSAFEGLINHSNAELNPICHMLALLGAHPILHIGRIKVNHISLAIFCQYFQCVEKDWPEQNVYLLELRLASPYQNIQTCNFACCFVWVWNLVCHIKGGTQAEGVWE